jgi:hypothetical protein
MNSPPVERPRHTRLVDTSWTAGPAAADRDHPRVTGELDATAGTGAAETTGGAIAGRSA